VLFIPVEREGKCQPPDKWSLPIIANQSPATVGALNKMPNKMPRRTPTTKDNRLSLF